MNETSEKIINAVVEELSKSMAFCGVGEEGMMETKISFNIDPDTKEKIADRIDSILRD